MTSKSLLEISIDLHEAVNKYSIDLWPFASFHEKMRLYFSILYDIDILPPSNEILVTKYNLESVESYLLRSFDMSVFYEWFHEKIFNEPDGPLDSIDVEKGIAWLINQYSKDDRIFDDDDLNAAISRQLAKELFMAELECDQLICNIKAYLEAKFLAIANIKDNKKALATAKAFRSTAFLSLDKCHKEIFKNTKK